jgi:hypothetical protein
LSILIKINSEIATNNSLKTSLILMKKAHHFGPYLVTPLYTEAPLENPLLFLYK